MSLRIGGSHLVTVPIYIGGESDAEVIPDSNADPGAAGPEQEP